MSAEFGDQRLPDRFWAKVVEDPTGCWIWTAWRSADGYGRFWVGGKAQAAHRVSYGALVGDLPAWQPKGLQLDHLCRVRACVNPAHLELVSNRENTLRGESPAADHAGRTHCPAGHPLVGGNLRAGQLRRGERGCLTCHRDHAAAIRGAARSLGLTRDAYGAAHGWSKATAERILERETR